MTVAAQGCPLWGIAGGHQVRIEAGQMSSMREAQTALACSMLGFLSAVHFSLALEVSKNSS